MGQWGDGEMGQWGDGEMGRWGDGEMGQWGDGVMGRWGDGVMGSMTGNKPLTTVETCHGTSGTTTNNQQPTINH